MSWFKAPTHPDSDSEGRNTETASTPQSWTPLVWSAAICRTSHPSLRPSSTPSTYQLASSHCISLEFHWDGTASPSGESTGWRIHSTWRNPNILPWHKSPAALDPLPLIIATIPEWPLSPVLDPDIEITSVEEESFNLLPSHHPHQMMREIWPHTQR